MAKKRLDKSLADYVVIAICPVLIMTLVGSLVFFLMELSYRGQFESRMQWIMFWFVFASVLVTRIAIEDGRDHARLYGLAMGLVTAIAILRFVDMVIVGWVLLGVVWWCSSKLTWDCTLIDDTEDASGEGLLHAAGFETIRPSDSDDRDTIAPTQKTISKIPTEKTQTERQAAKTKTRSKPKEQNRPSLFEPGDEDFWRDNKRPHTPGLWVVYFSLAALPLFGVGQLLIPLADSTRRSYAFQLLAVYVASAIALLLMTSFLGLRRYLRQRKLTMPISMTRRWLGIGIAQLIALMLCALLIPRPQGEYTISAMLDGLETKARQASKFAVIQDGRNKGDGRKSGELDATAEQGDKGRSPAPNPANIPKNHPSEVKSSDASQQVKTGEIDRDQKANTDSENQSSGDRGGQASKSNGKGERNGKDSGQTEQQRPSDGQSQQKRDPNSNQNSQSTNRPSSTTNSDSLLSILAVWIASVMKWFIYCFLAMTGLFFMFRFRNQVLESLAQIWREILAFFGRNPKSTELDNAKGIESFGPSQRAFASFKNPFSNGAARQMSSQELIRYSFEALEAWSREQVFARSQVQTPGEFAEELGRRVPAMANEVTTTAQLYGQIAYAGKAPSKERLEVLERLWRQIGA